MLQITAMIGDAHTYVHLPQTFKLYPVSLYWFGSDLRVVRAAPENKQALGAKVVKVGGMNISDVQTRRALMSLLRRGQVSLSGAKRVARKSEGARPDSHP